MIAFGRGDRQPVFIKYGSVFARVGYTDKKLLLFFKAGFEIYTSFICFVNFYTGVYGIFKSVSKHDAYVKLIERQLVRKNNA